MWVLGRPFRTPTKAGREAAGGAKGLRATCSRWSGPPTQRAEADVCWMALVGMFMCLTLWELCNVVEVFLGMVESMISVPPFVSLKVAHEFFRLVWRCLPTLNGLNV